MHSLFAHNSRKPRKRKILTDLPPISPPVCNNQNWRKIFLNYAKHSDLEKTKCTPLLEKLKNNNIIMLVVAKQIYPEL